MVMNKLMTRMVLSCEKATLLIEKKIDAGLSFGERLQLRVHTGICDACTNYQHQSRLIHELLGRHLVVDEAVGTIGYVAQTELKARIMTNLDVDKK
jgi:hypothetical protein